MTTPTALTCPKCQAEMRSYERNGVTIDQCSGCRGIFLDRGELERLVDAESAFYGSSSDQRAERPPRAREPEYEHGGYRGKPKRKSSFLSELFD